MVLLLDMGHSLAILEDEIAESCWTSFVGMNFKLELHCSFAGSFQLFCVFSVCELLIYGLVFLILDGHNLLF